NKETTGGSYIYHIQVDTDISHVRRWQATRRTLSAFAITKTVERGNGETRYLRLWTAYWCNLSLPLLSLSSPALPLRFTLLLGSTSEIVLHNRLTTAAAS